MYIKCEIIYLYLIITQFVFHLMLLLRYTCMVVRDGSLGDRQYYQWDRKDGTTEKHPASEIGCFGVWVFSHTLHCLYHS